MLSSVLAAPPPAASASEPAKVVTTQEELDAFEAIKKLLGAERPIAYEDSVAYFKVHLAGKRTWVFARLQMDRKNPMFWVPLSVAQVAPLVGNLPTNGTAVQGWTSVSFDSPAQLANLGELFRLAYQTVEQTKAGE